MSQWGKPLITEARKFVPLVKTDTFEREYSDNIVEDIILIGIEGDKLIANNLLAELKKKHVGKPYSDWLEALSQTLPIKIYLLTEDSEGFYGADEILSWHQNKDKLEELANKFEWLRYRAERDRYKNSSIKVLSPDETDYRRFTVTEAINMESFITPQDLSTNT